LTRTFSGTPLNADVGTVTITVTADDSNGGTPASDTFDIVIANTNDDPVIADPIIFEGTVDTLGTVTELADGAPGENATLLSDTGILPFTDVDLTDAHTVGVVENDIGYRGTLSALITDAATGDGNGAITWTFEVQDSALDDLAAGEELIQTYEVTVDDGNGGTDTQTVTITINGAEDAPVLGGTTSGDVTEDGTRSPPAR